MIGDFEKVKLLEAEQREAGGQLSCAPNEGGGLIRLVQGECVLMQTMDSRKGT